MNEGGLTGKKRRRRSGKEKAVVPSASNSKVVAVVLKYDSTIREYCDVPAV